MNAPNDPAAVVVPFGKHKGATVTDLLEKACPIAPESGRVSRRFAKPQIVQSAVVYATVAEPKEDRG